jgi:hypothetical protein
VSTESTQPLARAEQTESAETGGSVAGFESDSVIGDGDLDPMFGGFEVDPKSTGPGVLDDILDKLPGDAKQHTAQLVAGLGKRPVALDLEANPVVLLHSMAEILERRLEPQLVEDR